MCDFQNCASRLRFSLKIAINAINVHDITYRDFYICMVYIYICIYTFVQYRYLPINEGKVTQAGPGLLYSAAIGPRLFVGVQGLCVTPTMLLEGVFSFFCQIYSMFILHTIVIKRE